jgi:FixJ family two-component response regulator
VNAASAIVYIVDNDEKVRSSLQWLVEPLGLQVKAFAGAGAFLEAYDPATPGCVLLDVRMPEMSGLELQQRMNEKGWNVPIIFISGHADVPMSVRALKAGAFDFLEKPFNRQELVDRLQKAIALDRSQHDSRAHLAVLKARIALLSERERQVLDLVLAGRMNKQIADDLGITVRTVEAHRANLMAKMRANSVLELAQTIAELNNDHSAAA